MILAVADAAITVISASFSQQIGKRGIERASMSLLKKISEQGANSYLPTRWLKDLLR